MKNFIIRNMPDELHYKLKLIALQRSQAMNELITMILAEYTKNVKTEKEAGK